MKILLLTLLGLLTIHPIHTDLGYFAHYEASGIVLILPEGGEYDHITILLYGCKSIAFPKPYRSFDGTDLAGREYHAYLYHTEKVILLITLGKCRAYTHQSISFSQGQTF